jgi:phage baseplate assembly protein V
VTTPRSIASHLGMMLGIGRILATRTDRGKGRATLTAQVQISETGETRDDTPILSLYGFFSRPRADADAVVAFLGGNRAAGVIIATGDGRYGPDLAEGEFGLEHPDGARIIFRNGGGIEHHAPGGHVFTGGEITHNGRNIGATHRHSDVRGGSDQSGEPIP